MYVPDYTGLRVEQEKVLREIEEALKRPQRAEVLRRVLRILVGGGIANRPRKRTRRPTR